QGMILGESAFVYRCHLEFVQHKLDQKINNKTTPYFVSFDFVKKITQLKNLLFDDLKLSSDFKKNLMFGNGYESGLVYLKTYLSDDLNKLEEDYIYLQSLLSASE